LKPTGGVPDPIGHHVDFPDPSPDGVAVQCIDQLQAEGWSLVHRTRGGSGTEITISLQLARGAAGLNLQIQSGYARAEGTSTGYVYLDPTGHILQEDWRP
jgi:hypothetical protein